MGMNASEIITLISAAAVAQLIEFAKSKGLL